MANLADDLMLAVASGSDIVLDAQLQRVRELSAEHAELTSAFRHCLGSVLDGMDRDTFPRAEIAFYQALIAKAKGGAA